MTHIEETHIHTYTHVRMCQQQEADSVWMDMSRMITHVPIINISSFQLLKITGVNFLRQLSNPKKNQLYFLLCIFEGGDSVNHFVKFVISHADPMIILGLSLLGKHLPT